MTAAWTHDYASQIARELGAPWRYDPRTSRDADGRLHECATLKTDLGEFGVTIRTDWRNKSRLLIIGRIPNTDRAGNRHWHGTAEAPRITVAIERGPAAAARDILQRLLPRYRPVYKAARARVDSHNADLEALAHAEAVLAPYGHLAGGKTYNGGSDGVFLFPRQLVPRGGRGRFSTYRGAHLRLEVEVSPETAAKILALIQREEPNCADDEG